MVALGSDHGGFKLKEIIKKELEKKGIEYKDFGTNSEESVDYPKYALAVAKSVAEERCEKGILFCGTGIGVSIVANKVPGIRAAVVNDLFSAKVTKQHNNSNIICLGERVIDEELAVLIVQEWLSGEFEGGRHKKRIDMITTIEKSIINDSVFKLLL